MRYFIILFISGHLAGCSDEPNCVTSSQFSEKVIAGETRYSELSKHMTCYDKDGKPY